MKRAVLPAHRPHALHIEGSTWTDTISPVRLWIELLHGWGFEPLAMLASAVAQEFEGDQFVEFSPVEADLAALYGVKIFDLTIYDSLETQAALQTSRGNVVLLKVDPACLPDVRYRQYMSDRTTLIAVDHIDPENGIAWYYHGGGHYELAPADYLAIFRPGQQHAADISHGHRFADSRHERNSDGNLTDVQARRIYNVRCVKRIAGAPPREGLAGLSAQLLHAHLRCRTDVNPVRAFRLSFERVVATRLLSSTSFRHVYMASTLRRLALNFELFASYLSWLLAQTSAQHGPPVDLDGAPEASNGTGDAHGRRATEAIEASRYIADAARTCQFRLQRAASRGRVENCDHYLITMERAYDTLTRFLEKVPGKSTVHK